MCGPNNVGKSSFQTAIGMYKDLLGHIHAGTSASAKPIGGRLRSGRIGCALDLTHDSFLNFLRSVARRPEELDDFPDAIAETNCATLWLEYDISKERMTGPVDSHLEPLGDLFHRWEGQGGIRSRWIRLLAQAGGQRRFDEPASRSRWSREVAPQVLGVPDIRHISDIRRGVDQPLTDDEMKTLVVASGYSTTGRRRDEWADRLERMLQDVFGSDVRFQARPTVDGPGELLLAIDGETDVPVDQVGAGVREVIAIAFRALSSGGADVLTIEEPENCLHPAAVRRLVRSLSERANVQVVVSTHSAAVVNSRPDVVIELRREGTTTSSWIVSDASSRFRAVRALGHEPADLVMTPCAVWVEGPSDRLYVTAWLSAPRLTSVPSPDVWKGCWFERCASARNSDVFPASLGPTTAVSLPSTCRIWDRRNLL